MLTKPKDCKQPSASPATASPTGKPVTPLASQKLTDSEIAALRAKVKASNQKLLGSDYDGAVIDG